MLKKYLLIDKNSKEEYLCNMVRIDFVNYYYMSVNVSVGDFITDLKRIFKATKVGTNLKIIATINPSLGIPLINSVSSELALSHQIKLLKQTEVTKRDALNQRIGYIIGYKDAKNKFLFTKHDLVDLAKFIEENKGKYSPIEMAKTWYEQKVETIYFEHIK